MQANLPLLEEGARRLGFTLSDEQVAQFQTYNEMLVDWNSRMNLTAITDPEGVQVKHFVDSLTVGAAWLQALSEGGARPEAPPMGARIADIGTGAGFPGLPLKILWPYLEVMLSDSVGKKTTFLRAVADALGLDGVQVVNARAEELGQNKEHRQHYDMVTARAVAALPVLCEYCLPLAKVDGWLLAPKKGDISQEIREARVAAPILGGRPPELLTFTLPGEEEARYVVAIHKVKNTPPGYPRRVGLAKSRPLGSELR